MANRINYTIDFNVDKTSFAEINKYLDAIKASADNNLRLGGFDKELQQASKEAELLKKIMTESWNVKLNQLDLNKVNDGLKRTGLTVDQLRQSFTRIGPEGAAAFNAWSSSILHTNTQLKQSSKLLDDMATTFKNTVRYGISSSIFNNLSNGIQKAFNYTKQLDTSLNDIRIVTGYSAEEMEKFAVSANRVAKDLGKSTKDFTEASLIYYQQGLGAEEAQARAEVTLKAANVTGQTGREVSEQLTAVWNGYKVTSEEAELYVDKLAAVAAATAADLEELSTGMSKVASAANVMGVDIDQLNAQLATIVSATRQAPESVGVALKTIYARMSDIKSGLDDETTLGNYTEKMAQYGVNVLDANGNLRDMGEVIEEIGNKWESLSREQQVALSQVMAGTRQYNNLLSLFDNWDKYQEAMNISANAAGTLQKQQDIYMESTEAHLQKIRTEAERTYDILFDTDTVNSFADTLSNMLNIFNNFLEGIGGGTNAFIFFGSTLANIFNKQIGSAIERQIENIETMKANAAAASLKAENFVTSQLGADIRNQRIANGEVISDTALEEEVKWARELLQIRGTLTQEKYSELTAIQQKLGSLKEEIDYLSQYKNISQEIFGREVNSLSMWEDKLKEEEESLKNLEDEKEYLEILLKNNRNNLELDEAEQKFIYSKVDGYKELTKDIETQNYLEEVKFELVNKSADSQVHIQALLDAQNKEYENQINKINQLKQGIDGVKAKEGELYNKQLQYNQTEAYMNSELKKGNREQQIQQGIKGLTSLVSLTISLSGLIKTINDDSLSGIEKFERVLPMLLTTAPQLITFFKSVGSILPMLVIEFKAFGDSIAAAATEMLGFEVAAAPVLILITAIAVALTATGIAIYNYVKKQDEANKGLERATEAAKKATEELNKTREAYENLQSSIDKYSSTEKALNKLTEGTVEWKKQVIELNNIVLDLLEKYPKLAQYVSQNEKGIMSISSQGYQEILEEQQKKFLLAQMYSSQKQIDKKKAQATEDTKQMRDTLNKGLGSSNPIFTRMSDSDIQKLAKITAANQEVINKGDIKTITDMYEKNGINFAKYNGELNGNINYAVENIKNNNQALVDYTNKLGEYTDQIAIYSNSIVTTAASTNPLYETSKYKSLMNPILEKDYDKAYAEELERLNKVSFEDIAETYKTLFGTDKDQTYGKRKIWGKGGLFGADTSGFYLAQSSKEKSNDNWIKTSDAKERIAQEYAQRYVAETATPTSGTINRLIESLNKQSKGEDLGKSLEAYKSGTSLNTLYTKDELDKVKESFLSLDKNTQARIGELFGDEFSKGFLATVDNTLKNYDDSIYAQSMRENFDKVISANAEEMKEKYELNEEDFKDYANQLSDIAADKVYDVGNKLADSMEGNAEVTSIVAKSIMRMNKGIDELANNWKDWNSILKKSSASSEEYSKALNGTRDALGDLLDIEEDAQKYFTNDFIQKHLEEIGKAAEGDAKAIESLRAEFAKEVIVQIYAENKIDMNNLSSDIKNSIENLNRDIPDIQVGYKINPNDESYNSFLENCQNIINSAKMTEEQANAFFASMGFDAEFETEPQKIEKTGYSTITSSKLIGTQEYETINDDGTVSTIKVPSYETFTKPGTPYKTFDYVDVVSMGVQTPNGQGHSPKIKSLTKKGTGSMNNYSPSNSGGTKSPGGKSSGGGKKGKSGGGSADKPDKMDPLKEEKDRYHEVNVQLQLIENELKKLDRAKEKAFGKAKIELLNKELKKYEEQIKTINQKLKIAQGETDELRKKLAKQGVKFGADGAVSNYVAAIQAQENAVNKIIDKYNKMSKAQQENYKDTVEEEKKNFEEFKKNLDRYDELVSSVMPDLSENIQDAIDKQIDIQIEEFDMEIELRLNLKEAKQDWNTFLKEVEKDFDKNNPIGDLFKDYEDLKTLLADDNKGLSQALGRQLQNTLDELYKMDEGKNSDVYGADRVKALEDLKKYLDESIAALEEIEDLEDSIHEDFIKNMDAIQDRFDKQIEDYETISKLLDHDKEIIELVSGDNAYKQLAQFYDKQEDNYKKQLAFQSQQVIFWREQLESLDESSNEWEDARKKWADAVEEYNDLIEDSIENLQDKYLNTIKDIFNDLNNRLSGGRGLEGMNDQWKLLNLESEEYLDNVNAIYQTQQLANKYLDAIDNTSNIKAQQRLREIMDDELDNLRQKDKLSEYDLQRAELRYQIAVKQIALEEAQQNKSKMRLRRDTQGNYRYEYIADSEQLNKSKQEISDFYNQLYNLDAKKYSENLDKVYNLTKEAEDRVQELYEDTTLSNEERQERILETTQYYGELIDQLIADNEIIKQNLNESTMSELFDLYDINKDNYAEMTNTQQDLLNKYLVDSENLTNAAYDNLFGLYNQNVENFKNMTNEELDVLMEELIPGWDSAYQTMIDNLYAEGGFVPATEDAYAQAGVAAEEYYNKVIELSYQSDEATKHAIDTINTKREADEEALKVINEQMKAGKEYLKYLEDLIKIKEEDIKKTKEQTEAAYKYWQEQQRQAADAAQKEAEKKKEEAAKKAEESKKSTSTNTSTTSSGNKSSSSSSGKGDGKLSVGDTATYTGKYYYDSKGKSPSGSRYSGVKNGIIVDRINGNAYGVHIKSADGKYSDLGWVKKSQLSGYDTGGYTGSWGKDGRLALLHQKELVLNATDTQNMLDAVKIIRQITDSLGSTILGRLADIGSAGMGNLVTGSNSIDQNVHIEANFPNVTKHDEIEQALNNLVNAAAHRVNKKI